VAHTAASDHRILRRPDAEGPAARPPARPRPGEWPFVAFHHDLPGVGERELNRDRGLALVAMARKMPRSAAPVAVGYALPLLEDALAAWPGDVPCREGQVYALLVQDRPEEALEAGEAALALAPGREQVLIDLVQVCQALGRPREGLDYCRRALAVAPSSAPYRLNEARLLGQREDWSGAVASARRAVQVDPFAVDAHLVLADGCLHTGRKEEARAELDVLAALDPSRAEQFRRWFAEQLR
jgi:tetratricopeptide (TPR) repeat protein